jgi:mannitol-1-phosphate/altronate dehydrogenase
LLDGGHSVSAVIGILKGDFEVDDKTLEKDVIDFLKGLISREIIK